MKRFRTAGDLRPTPAIPPALGWWEELRQEVQAPPDRCQSEPAKQFGVVQSTLSKAFKPLGRTRKTKTTACLGQNETDKQAFLARIQESPVATQVYLDDSGSSPQLARASGWAPIGEPVTFQRLGHRTPNLNLLAALSDGESKAPVTYEGAMNTAGFNIYLREPRLPALSPGKILHRDNASLLGRNPSSNRRAWESIRLSANLFTRVKSHGTYLGRVNTLGETRSCRL